MALMTVGKEADAARKFAFSAATLIQEGPLTSEDWEVIAEDLEKAAKAAYRTAEQLRETKR